MKKILLYAFVLLLSVLLIGCVSAERPNRQEGTIQKTNEADKEAVAAVVEGFGKKLQSVSLLAPKDILEESMKENYGNFVSQELIGKWISDPLNAPGRLTSSPWPDRIEILTVEKSSENEYEVKGEIIEVTSTEKTESGVSAKRPITLTVKKFDERWLIAEVILGDYVETK